MWPIPPTRSGRRLTAGGRSARAGRPSPLRPRSTPSTPSARRRVLGHEKFDPDRGVLRTLGVGAQVERGHVRTSHDAPARHLGPAPELASTPEGRRRLLMGRLAGVLFLASSGLMLIALPLSPADASIAGTVAVAASGAAVGCFAMFAPWDAWPRSRA